MKEGDKGLPDRKRNISVNHHVMFEKTEKKKMCVYQGWNEARLRAEILMCRF